MTTLTLDAFRSGLLEHLKAGRSYEFLGHADHYLQTQPEDSYLRLMAAREYLKMGLAIPARELLAAGAALPDASDEFAELLAPLQKLRSSLIPWSVCEARYKGNLDAAGPRGKTSEKSELQQTQAQFPLDVDLVRSAWETQFDAFQLFRDSQGEYQVRMRDEEGNWRWIPALRHHKSVDAARPMPEGIGGIMPGPYLFEGLDLGGYFERLVRATHNTFLGYSCALYVVEPDPALVALVLHLREWRDILSDPRVLWFVGPHWRANLEAAWRQDFDLPWPRQALMFSAYRSGGPVGSVEAVHRAGADREQAVRESFAELERRYAERDRAYWSRRFDEALSGRGRPLQVLAAVSTHTTFLQYSMRDAQRALKELGHDCTVLTEKTPYAVIGPLTYHAAIRELDPDLFFSLDHFRPEFAYLIPSQLPILTWDQDQLPHVFTRANLAKIAAHDFVTGCSKSKWVELGFQPQQFLHARLPTCSEQFGGPPLTADEIGRYGCDVSYVSHASQTAQDFHDEQRRAAAGGRFAEFLDYLFEILPRALQAHRVPSGYLADELIQEGYARLNVSPFDPEWESWIRCWYLWRLGDRLFRHEALEWVARWAEGSGRTFRIYGNGWDRHPTLARFAAGPAANGRELLCIYRATRINLQLMPAGFIHQRALDGLAAGGFFLTRRVPHDGGGRVLKRLAARRQDLEISDSAALLNHPDIELRSLLNSWAPLWCAPGFRPRNNLIAELELSAELTYPDEVFEGFEQITFDSLDEFGRAANRFLAYPDVRKRMAEQMRNVVLNHFSYGPTMAQFLRAMATHLASPFHP